MSQKVIRNITQVPQWVMNNGKKHTIGPGEAVVLPDEIVTLFVQERGQSVSVEDGHSPIVIDDEANWNDRVYLYNMSGNPDEPEMLKITTYAKGHPVVNEVPNPRRAPRILSWKKNLGAIRISSDAERKLGHRVLTLAPFQRKAFSTADANWIMQREGIKEPGNPSLVNWSAEPTGFEPDSTWTYADVYDYAQLIGLAPLPPTPRQVQQKAEKDGYGEKATGEVYDELRNELLTRLYFLIADPKHHTPTESEFREYQAGRKATAAARNPAKRGPGRPRKNPEVAA